VPVLVDAPHVERAARHRQRPVPDRVGGKLVDHQREGRGRPLAPARFGQRHPDAVADDAAAVVGCEEDREDVAQQRGLAPAVLRHRADEVVGLPERREAPREIEARRWGLLRRRANRRGSSRSTTRPHRDEFAPNEIAGRRRQAPGVAARRVKSACAPAWASAPSCPRPASRREPRPRARGARAGQHRSGRSRRG
jgi:hypothetical protein